MDRKKTTDLISKMIQPMVKAPTVDPAPALLRDATGCHRVLEGLSD